MKRKRMFLAYLLIAAIVVTMGYVRLAPNDPNAWHQDPETVRSTGKPNEHRLIGNAAPVFDVPADKLLELLDEYLQGQSHISRLAGHPDDLMITYVERSIIMSYPDYITVKTVSLDPNQTKLSIYSRSRFGHSDFGVNRRRVSEWVAAIQALITR